MSRTSRRAASCRWRSVAESGSSLSASRGSRAPFRSPPARRLGSSGTGRSDDWGRAVPGGSVSSLAQRSRPARPPDRGSVTPFVALLCAALLALIALVVDGGRALGAREAALGEAEQ